MNKYWTTTSTDYYPKWESDSTSGKVSITYITKK